MRWKHTVTAHPTDDRGGTWNKTTARWQLLLSLQWIPRLSLPKGWNCPHHLITSVTSLGLPGVIGTSLPPLTNDLGTKWSKVGPDVWSLPFASCLPPPARACCLVNKVSTLRPHLCCTPFPALAQPSSNSSADLVSLSIFLIILPPSFTPPQLGLRALQFGLFPWLWPSPFSSQKNLTSLGPFLQLHIKMSTGWPGSSFTVFQSQKPTIPLSLRKTKRGQWPLKTSSLLSSTPHPPYEVLVHNKKIFLSQKPVVWWPLAECWPYIPHLKAVT